MRATGTAELPNTIDVNVGLATRARFERATPQAEDSPRLTQVADPSAVAGLPQRSIAPEPPEVLALVAPQRSGVRLRTPAPLAPALVEKVDGQRLETPNGTFVVSVDWRTNDLNAPTLRGHVAFTPRAGLIAGDDDIAFVQIARVQLSSGEDYQWAMGEAPRTAMFTRASPGGRVQPGFYVDHLAAEASGRSAPSPFFRDYWPGDGEAQDGVVRAGQVLQPASLVDYPFGWDQIDRISLEACAISRRTGVRYGCVRWGAHWPPIGERRVYAPTASPTASNTFDDALARFRAHYARNATTP